MQHRDKQNAKRDSHRYQKDQQKALLRLLEECKQIPKDDRLELRSLIKNQNNDLVYLFRSFKKVSQSSLQNLQIALRRYLTKYKQEKEEEMMRVIREANGGSNVSPPKRQIGKVLTKSLTKTKSQCQTPMKRPWWFQRLSKSREKSQNSGFRSPEMQASTLQSPVPAPTPDERFNKEVSVNPYFYGSETPRVPEMSAAPIIPGPMTPQDCFSRIPPIPPAASTQQSLLFTNPKILEQCHKLLLSPNPKSPTTHYTPFCSKLPPSTLQSLKSHLLFLRGRDGQDIISWFFPDTSVITKQEFLQRMNSYMQLQLAPIGNLESIFELISKDKKRVFVSEMGRMVDELCLQSLTNTEVRIMYSRLGKFGRGVGHDAPEGRLGRGLFGEEGKWMNLYQRAVEQGRNHIGYWEMYAVGKTWEYMCFSIWFREKHNLSTFKFEVDFF